MCGGGVTVRRVVACHPPNCEYSSGAVMSRRSLGWSSLFSGILATSVLTSWVAADDEWLPASMVGVEPAEAEVGDSVSADQMSDMEFNRRLPEPEQFFSGSADDSCSDECGDLPIPKGRKGCWQGASVISSYLHDDSATGLAIGSMDASTTFGVPLGSYENILLVTPFFRADFLSSAAVFDLPSEVYETGVRGFWRKSLNERLSTMAIVTPGVRTDFRNSDGAVRLFGLGLLTWQAVPERLALSGGAVYTGRDDFPVLPAAGLLWTPSSEWKFDVQFPSPRISRRLMKDGQSSELWGYLSGVFGGNTWAVQRASGLNDQLTIRDLRLMLGVEQLLPENQSAFVECGLVFDRSFSWESGADETQLDSTWILRAGVSF